MLRTFLVMSASGLVLYHKALVHAVGQPRLVGSLIAALMQFSAHNLRHSVSYVQMSDLAVFVASSERFSKITGVLFQDACDSPALGRLVSTALLEAFCSMFAERLARRTASAVDAVDQFREFDFAFADIIRGSVRAVVQELKGVCGVRQVVLLRGGDVVMSAHADVDQIGLAANVQFLMDDAAVLLRARGDEAKEVELVSDDGRIVVRRMVAGGDGDDAHGAAMATQASTTTLVLVLRANIARRQAQLVDEYVRLVEEVALLHARLRLSIT